MAENLDDRVKKQRESIELEQKYNDALKMSQSINSAINASINSQVDGRTKIGKKVGDYLKDLKSSVSELETSEDISKKLVQLENEKEKLLKNHFGSNKKTGQLKARAVDDTIKLLRVEEQRLLATERLNEIASNFTNDITNGLDQFLTTTVSTLPLVGGMLENFLKTPFDNIGKTISNTSKTFVSDFKSNLENGASSMDALKISGGSAFKTITKGISLSQIALLGFVGLLVMGIKSFMDFSEASQSFREQTGLLKNDTQGLSTSIKNVTANTSSLGATFGEVADAASTLSNEFQNIVQPSQELLENTIVLNKNFGISIEELAGVNKLFQSIAGVSADTAGFMASTVVQAADLAGVAPKKVIEDIAKSSEEALKYFGGSVQELTSAAIQAAKLGTSLEQSAEVAKSLLDFESSITSELEASAILGTRINFNDARRLAANGKILEAQQAVLDEVSKIGDITKLNVFEQEALAEAAGMPLSDLLFQQQIRNNFSDLDKEELKLAMEKLKAGTDISDISKEQLQTETASLAKQQQIQSEVQQLKNAFMGVVATLGSVLIPLLEVITPIISLAFKPISIAVEQIAKLAQFIEEMNSPLLNTALIFSTIVGYQKRSLVLSRLKSAAETAYLSILYAKDAILKSNLFKSIAEMATSAFSSVAKIPFIGPALGAAAAASAFALGKSYFSKADDFMSMPDGYGKRMLTTPEGTFAINDNDTIIGGTELDSTKNNNVVGNNLPDLAAPMNMMIQELKALRNDMNTGKVAVYLDGKKVTSQISRIVDKSSKNSYAI